LASQAAKSGPSRGDVRLPLFVLRSFPSRSGSQWLHEIKLDGYRTGIPRERSWVPSPAARNRSTRTRFARQSNTPNLSLFGIDSANTIPEYSP
jgi:hypothetical protein